MPQQDEGQVMVPNLKGKTIREAAQILSDLDLLLQAEGTGLAVWQDPAPLTVVSVGSLVEVKFAPPTS